LDELGFVNGYEQIEREYLDTCLTLDGEFISIAEELGLSMTLPFCQLT